MCIVSKGGSSQSGRLIARELIVGLGYLIFLVEEKEGTDQISRRISVQGRRTGEGTDLMQDAWQKYSGIGNMKGVKARGWRVAWVVGEFSVGPPFGDDPWDKCGSGSKTNKQTNIYATEMHFFPYQGPWDDWYLLYITSNIMVSADLTLLLMRLILPKRQDCKNITTYLKSNLLVTLLKLMQRTISWIPICQDFGHFSAFFVLLFWTKLEPVAEGINVANALTLYCSMSEFWRNW